MKKIIKANMVISIIAIILFLVEFNKCGKTFDMCISLFFTYATLAVASLVAGYISAGEGEKFTSKLKLSIMGTISIPFAIILIVGILQPTKLLNIKDLIVQFYLLIPAIVGGLLRAVISKLK